MSKGDAVLFPRRVWMAWGWHHWSPVARGGDEWGQHAIVLAIPFVGPGIVIVTRRCPRTGKCADMAGFRCKFPYCPQAATTTDAWCMTHDLSFWTDVAVDEWHDADAPSGSLQQALRMDDDEYAHWVTTGQRVI